MEDNTDSEREFYKIIQVFTVLKMQTKFTVHQSFQDIAILSENLKNGGGLSGDNMQLVKQTIRPARYTLQAYIQSCLKMLVTIICAPQVHIGGHTVHILSSSKHGSSHQERGGEIFLSHSPKVFTIREE